VEPLSPFALACQLDKDLGPDVDYMALRRGEDAEAMRRLGVVDSHHLDLPEAPHRGYGSAPELFAGRRPGDDIAAAVEQALAPLVDGADLVLGPQGLGSHVDHLVVRDALASLDLPLLGYRDTPYATRLTVSGCAADEVAVDVAEALDDKLAACAAYASQLGFQFGGPDAMGEALRDFAAAEARRCGGAGAAEVLAGSDDARTRLSP
jgi:LmbE family N-acetylglucosaminyl deacetylase